MRAYAHADSTLPLNVNLSELSARVAKLRGVFLQPQRCKLRRAASDSLALLGGRHIDLYAK